MPDLRDIAIQTVQRLKEEDFIYTVDDWDIYHFPGRAVGTIALRIEGEPQRLHIGLFVPLTLTLDEIRKALKDDPFPNQRLS
jgi:hypothetical protein